VSAWLQSLSESCCFVVDAMCLCDGSNMIENVNVVDDVIGEVAQASKNEVKVDADSIVDIEDIVEAEFIDIKWDLYNKVESLVEGLSPYDDQMKSSFFAELSNFYANTADVTNASEVK